MVTYKYSAISRSGKRVNGVVEAFNEMDAVDRIKRDCPVVLKISEVKSGSGEGILNMEIGGAKLNGKAFTVKFAVTVGGKTWKPTYTISAATGAQTIGIAKISVANYVSEMSQNLSLLSASGELAPLVGKSWDLSSATAGSGLGEGDALTITLAAGDKLSWKGMIGGVAVSGSSPCAMRTATASGTSVVYAAKAPICIPSAGYTRLAVCKITRTKAGACTAKWSFANF